MKTKHTSCDHELREGEKWLGNTCVSDGSTMDPEMAHLKTLRLGEQAYDINGEEIDRDYYRPLIIHISEFDEWNNIMMECVRKIRNTR
jgi:hypothetical protein